MADTLLGALRNLALDQLRSKLKKKQYNQVVSPSYLLYLSAANTERVAEEDERSPCVLGRLPGANLAGVCPENCCSSAHQNQKEHLGGKQSRDMVKIALPH